MRRLISLGSVAITLLAVSLPSAAHAAPLDGCDSKSTTPVQVTTVPAVPLFSFSVGEQTYATGPDGTAVFPASQCGAVVAQEQVRDLGNGQRLRFQRWFGGRTGGYVATFFADYQVTMHFTDRRGRTYPASKIDSVSLKNSLGVHERLKPGGTRWLLGSRGVRRSNGIHVSRVYWTLEDATIGGLGIVNRNQLKFYPDETREPVSRLLLFDANLHTFDAFFGLSLGGTQLKLIYPNGRIEFHDFDGGGRLKLRNLPRGQYDMVVIGPGLKMKSPVAITRDQDVDLKVLTYLDLTAVVLFGLMLAGGLLAYGWHRRRRRLRLLTGPPEGEQTAEAATPVERTEVNA